MNTQTKNTTIIIVVIVVLAVAAFSFKTFVLNAGNTSGAQATLEKIKNTSNTGDSAAAGSNPNGQHGTGGDVPMTTGIHQPGNKNH